MLVDPEILIHSIFIVVPLLIGLALVFVTFDVEQLRRSIHSNPGLALYRFRAFRYGAAMLCFIGAATSWLTL
ncbi:hypothetical protein ELE36_02215 [Pseudolysobacter antarcticus]|uniref:Uncharacterized protein n=1 Tax=Pseudolysobacter antarcticus TaxID=2511995 RepID=A0A411HFM0_9GAMM|nr:hypothetical protein [Pseudolysobacter antarcticus]QBB69282.1 hypothetical protein ELE36_02215 [Pseudolysobacter antarcticus]